MKALAFAHRPIVQRSNTDLRYMHSLRAMHRYGDVDFVLPDDFVLDVTENASALRRVIAARLGWCLPANDDLIPAMERRLARLRRQESWDIFYTNGSVPDSADLGAVIRFDYIHEPLETTDPGAFARDVALKTRTAALCDAVQVSTRSQKALFVRIGVPEEKVAVVPFFLPHAEAAPTERIVAKQKRADPLRIAFVGHQARRKGLDALLEAIDHDALRGVPLELTVVSKFLDGPVELPRTERVLRHRELMRSAVMKLLGDAHVLAVPSRRETFGLVYVEAMAAGAIPVTAAGPQQEDICSGTTAGFPTGSDPERIAAALRTLYEDRDRRIETALAARDLFCRRYAPAVVAGQYRDMFTDAVARRR